MEIKNNVNKLDSHFNQADLDKLAAQRKGSTQEVATVSGAIGDTVSIASNSLKTVVIQAAQNAPEVRRELVDNIKERIAASKYQADNSEVAAKLLEADTELF